MSDLAQAHEDSSVVITAPILLRAADAAHYLGLSKATFYRVVRPEVAPVRVSERRLAFRVSDLDDWAARREVRRT